MELDPDPYWKPDPSAIISSLFLDNSIACASFSLFAAPPPIGNVLLSRMLFTSYRFISKFVTAFKPRNFIAAISYASAASSSVPAFLLGY